MKKSGLYTTASLSMQVDGDLIADDASFDQKDFLRRVAASPECPKSSCPSPEEYMKLYEGEEKRVYVVTLSSELSGSYNSAELGRKLFAEEHGESDKQIYVFNSRSASVGETLIGMKIRECEEQGLGFRRDGRGGGSLYPGAAYVFCPGESGYAPQERPAYRYQVFRGQRAEHQTGHGIHTPGDDLPARPGPGDQKGACEDGGPDREGCMRYSGEGAGDRALQLSGTGAGSGADAPGPDEGERELHR